MSEDVIAWITKIMTAYAECRCGKVCHIDVTIRNMVIQFRVICPECGTVHSLLESIFVITKAGIDPTDVLLDRIRREFKAGVKE